MNYRYEAQLKFSLPLFLTIGLLVPGPAIADIEQLQALSFGTLVVLRNSEAESFKISKTGDISSSDAFRIVDDPQRARFRLFNIPASTTVSISTIIDQSTLTSASPNAQRFTFESLDHNNLVTTDQTGEAFVWVGGQISTSGEGPLIYGSLPLTANYQFIIDF